MLEAFKRERERERVRFSANNLPLFHYWPYLLGVCQKIRNLCKNIKIIYQNYTHFMFAEQSTYCLIHHGYT